MMTPPLTSSELAVGKSQVLDVIAKWRNAWVSARETDPTPHHELPLEFVIALGQDSMTGVDLLEQMLDDLFSSLSHREDAAVGQAFEAMYEPCKKIAHQVLLNIYPQDPTNEK